MSALVTPRVRNGTFPTRWPWRRQQWLLVFTGTCLKPTGLRGSSSQVEPMLNGAEDEELSFIVIEDTQFYYRHQL